MELALSLALGIGLAAACGFRVFVPLLATSLAAHAGHLELAPSMSWLASDAALATFGLATVLEIGAYYVPWLDNALDTIAGPAAVVAGGVITAAAVTDVSPFLRWTLVAIAGSAAAGAVQVATTGIRHLSSLTTLGLGNPIVSTVEAGGSVVLAALALFLPIVAAGVVALLLFVAARVGLALWRRTRSRPLATA